MSLVGNLEDLALVDIFQIINLSGKSGVLLIVQGPKQTGRIIFLKGKIISAWMPMGIHLLSEILAREKLTLPGPIARMRSEQSDPLPILKKTLAPPMLPEDRSMKLLEEFTKSSLLELMRWKTGSFQFELRGNHPNEPDILDGWYLIPEGISPNYIGLEGTRLDDEESQKGPAIQKVESKAPPESPYREPLFSLAEELRDQLESETHRFQTELSPGLNLLKGMLFELNLPNVHTYIALLVLRYASALMNRAILFEVQGERFVGLGEFGLTPEKEESARLVRRIQIPRKVESVLTSVEEDLLPLKLAPDPQRKWDTQLIELLGGKAPAEIFLGPLVQDGRLVALLYGDNLPEEKPIGNTETLEIFLSQAGIAMERALKEGFLK